MSAQAGVFETLVTNYSMRNEIINISPNDIPCDFPRCGVVFVVDRVLTWEILEIIPFFEVGWRRKIRCSIKVMRISIAAGGKARYHIRCCPYVV